MIEFNGATGQTTSIVLHLVKAWNSVPGDEMPRCGCPGDQTHVGYRTACDPGKALEIARRDGVVLCGACVVAWHEREHGRQIVRDLVAAERRA